MELTETNEESINILQSSTKAKLINIFKNCLNILRDNEGLIGEKALRTLSYLFILKLIEPHFGNEIDIDNFEYDFSDYIDEIAEQTKKNLLRFSRFSNLAVESEDNILSIVNHLWEKILSVHPSTNKIFLKGKGFDIKYSSTFKILLTKLNSIDLTSLELDILGSAYEEVIKDVMKGKVLGQFFTQLLVKKIMVDLINPQIYPDGKIETCGDPTMGTGGFLITYLDYILKQAKEKGITPDWNFIKTEGLYGKEIEPDTYQLAVSNMLISSGHMFEHLDCGDSIRIPITRKFDNILANPPFGIKGLKYDSFKSPLKNQYVPIKTNNAVSLFIQAIIYMLKENGKCAVVLPDGQDLFNKTNETLVAVREYLMKTCELKEIIYLKSGIFENTTVETSIFFFVKKKECQDILEINYSRKNTTYKFVDDHQTRNVKFYETFVINQNKDCERIEKKLLIEVPIEKIAENKYSLNYSEYLDISFGKKLLTAGVVEKSLDKLFNIEKGVLQSTKNTEGEFTFITAADEYKTHNNFTHNCECIFIVGGAEGSLAKAHYFKGKFIASDLLFILQRKNENEIDYKFAWYFLNFNREKHLNDNTICCGTPKKSISLSRCNNIKIPIPAMEIQHQIVKKFEDNNKEIKKLEEEIEKRKNDSRLFFSELFSST